MADFASALLSSLGARSTPENLRFVNAWIRAEGTRAAFNPLATTQQAPGSYALPGNAAINNGIAVQQYPDFATGLAATVKTLNNGRYVPIVSGLRSGTATAAQLAQAVADSPWGTGRGVLNVLGASGGGAITPPASPSVPTATAVPSTPSTVTVPSAPNIAGALLTSLGQSPGAQLNSIMGALAATPPPTTVTLPTPTASPVPSAAPLPSATPALSVGTGSRAGLAEAFYDPLGSWDNGRFGGPIGGHSDHVHISASTPTEMLKAIRLAQSMGLSVRENPYVDPVDPVHVQGSYHYRTFPGQFGGKKLGEAIDVSGPASSMAAFYKAMTGSK
jgi:hypothetical protein